MDEGWWIYIQVEESSSQSWKKHWGQCVVTSSVLRWTEPGRVPRAKGQEFPLNNGLPFFGTVQTETVHWGGSSPLHWWGGQVPRFHGFGLLYIPSTLNTCSAELAGQLNSVKNHCLSKILSGLTPRITSDNSNIRYRFPFTYKHQTPYIPNCLGEINEVVKKKKKKKATIVAGALIRISI